MKEYRVTGPPGCGKTDYIKRQVSHAATAYGSTKVTVCSLTRTAAANVAAVATEIPRDNIGTIHSLAYRAIGAGDIAETKAESFNEFCAENKQPAMKLNAGITKQSTDDDVVEPLRANEESPGDKNYAEMNRLRAKMRPIELWPDNVRAFYRLWQQWKTEVGIHDFTDLLEISLRDVATAPGDPAALFADESQDFSKLAFALLRKWGERAIRFIHVGDVDQCQPADTQVLTTAGHKRIADLDEKTDKLVSYDRNSGVVVGFRDGYSFKKAERNYQGTMIGIVGGSCASESTADHRWLVRFKPDAQQYYCTYLMRQGKRWRVGWCKVFDCNGAFQLGNRARCERADNAWILRVFSDSQDAANEEKIASIQFGLPQICFWENNGFSKETIDTIYEALDESEQAERAERCLAYYGRMIKHPLWYGKNEKKGIMRVFECRACNLFPEIMRIPVHNGRSIEWDSFQLLKREAKEKVYSLNVEPHHNYIADGLVTCNCLYEWAGVSVDSFSQVKLPEDQIKVLSQSWRVPQAAHALAVKWINATPGRKPIEYKPRDFPGIVRRLNASVYKPEKAIADAKAKIADGKTCMFLTTCSYMLNVIIRELRNAGIAFHNPYRVSRGDWNPLNRAGTTAVARLLAFVKVSPGFVRIDPDAKEPPAWTWGDVAKWAAWIKGKGILVHGAKAAIERNGKERKDERVDWLELANMFSMEHWDGLENARLEWWGKLLPEERVKQLSYPVKILKKGGIEALEQEPKCIVTTIHAAKGGESDVCYVFPDLSPQAHAEWLGGNGREGIRRAFYVAFTRAREELVLCQPETSMSIRI